MQPQFQTEQPPTRCRSIAVNDLYDSELAGWRREGTEVANHAPGGRSKRRITKVLWWNF